LEFANLEFDLDKHIAEEAVRLIPKTKERLGPRQNDLDSSQEEYGCLNTDLQKLILFINRYFQLHMFMEAVQTPINYKPGGRKRRAVFTGKAIGIMALFASRSVAAHLASLSNGRYNKTELCKLKSKVNIIKTSTADSSCQIEKHFNLHEKSQFMTLQALNKVQE
jgi:hypothetical protein